MSSEWALMNISHNITTAFNHLCALLARTSMASVARAAGLPDLAMSALR